MLIGSRADGPPTSCAKREKNDGQGVGRVYSIVLAVKTKKSEKVKPVCNFIPSMYLVALWETSNGLDNGDDERNGSNHSMCISLAWLVRSAHSNLLIGTRTVVVSHANYCTTRYLSWDLKRNLPLNFGPSFIQRRHGLPVQLLCKTE